MAKEIETLLEELPLMHPRLHWDEIISATIAVMAGIEVAGKATILIDARNMPGYGSNPIGMTIQFGEVDSDKIDRLRRTYEPYRLVELAAVGVAGVAIFAAGGHEIRDVALRGSHADYLIDDEEHLLEIAGRSRRSDSHTAWVTRWNRLSSENIGGFYVCVVEFETPAGRVAFGLDGDI